MNKKTFIFSLIIFIIFSLVSFSNATDIVMNLNSSNSSSNAISNTTNAIDTNTVNNTATTDNTLVDNTIYSPNTNSTLDATSELQEPITSATTEYEDNGDLTIGNMINIILIVVGIVLILLGIAIIIRLK